MTGLLTPASWLRTARTPVRGVRMRSVLWRGMCPTLVLTTRLGAGVRATISTTRTLPTTVRLPATTVLRPAMYLQPYKGEGQGSINKTIFLYRVSLNLQELA